MQSQLRMALTRPSFIIYRPSGVLHLLTKRPTVPSHYTLQKKGYFASSVGCSTLTEGQPHLDSLKAKVHIPTSSTSPKQAEPYIYQQASSAWEPVSHTRPPLRRGSTLTIASWKLDWSSPDPAARTLAALDHLEHVFGTEPEDLVIMLQEISTPAMRTMLESPWVRRNFLLSDMMPPETSRRITLNKMSVSRSAKETAPYFTAIMVSKALPLLSCFRAPLVTNMGRDALTVDIHVRGLSDEKDSHQRDCIRLCTTHLESFSQETECRLRQLSVISGLLKCSTLVPGRKVIAGIVGGDMNSISKREHGFHRKGQVNLKDVWEDAQPESSQGVDSHGEDNWTTWGRQSVEPRDSRRMDKFLYWGAIETLTVEDAQDATGRIGRFGIGLRTEVEAWELEREVIAVDGAYPVKTLHKEFVSQEWFDSLGKLGFLGSYKVKRTKMDSWVSDHFGITAKIKLI